MQTRRLGRTGHDSSLMIFGGYAFSNCTQAEADAMMDQIMARGVNHLDIAPSYGTAESRLGPWLAHHRDEVFLGCKTTERSKDGAWAELRRSLAALHAGQFDLYQLHAVCTMDELDAVFAPGGALEAVVEARQQGLVKHIGITGHGYDAPVVHARALERFDFDTVMTPLNFVQYADPTFRHNFDRLNAMAQARDVGVMVIKAVTKGPWGERQPAYNTWYEPFDTPAGVEDAVRFALSQPVTGFCSPGDLRLLPLALDAAERFEPMSPDEQAVLMATAAELSPLFPGMIAIRREGPGDIAAVRAVEEAAFGRPAEADAVDAVRRNGHATLSLVALVEGRVVGHILFSPLEIETAAGPASALALAPLAVLPEFQRQGVGSALTKAGLDECRALGAGCVVLLGHPSYYPRFGFTPASRYGLRCAFQAPDEAFMVAELEEGFLAGKAGMVRFSPEWDGL